MSCIIFDGALKKTPQFQTRDIHQQLKNGDTFGAVLTNFNVESYRQ